MAVALSEAELLALADALADGAWHSGEDLAAQAGITRAALAKRIDRLRDWQLDIETRHGLGYRLAAPLERLDEKKLRAALPRELGVRVLALTDSTNTQLLGADAAHDPQALLAEFQTGGRGRRGRAWVSPFGANLYFSLAVSFSAWPRDLPALSLAVGVASARVLRAHGAEVGLKWPNDLWIGGRKLGGILIEHRGEAGGACRAVIGVGLNLAMSRAQAGAIDQPWIALEEALNRRVPRNELAAALLAALLETVTDFEREGFAPFVADWNRFDLTAGRSVRVEREPPLSGIARGIDASGALIVEAGGQRHAIVSGEVSLRLA
ncbi:MAG TPA: biotin--[acetyl-CoA-carboxylase] ligase [Nevskiaceae bacterium]|nr:biotin--[acetyl-CoA-carboxylase] ligase [Nevskiaceae bacterium]